jgi:hypothetical protein
MSAPNIIVLAVAQMAQGRGDFDVECSLMDWLESGFTGMARRAPHDDGVVTVYPERDCPRMTIRERERKCNACGK